MEGGGIRDACTGAVRLLCTGWYWIPIGPTNLSKPRPRYKYHVLLSLTILHIQPLKMEQIECSETSANHNQMPGKYPKEYRQ